MTQLMPGAEPWLSEGGGSDGGTGILVLHGFTGNPQSMRPLAEAFAAVGYTVSMPLLPGHGTRVEDMLPTRWEDWSTAAEEAFEELAGRSRTVVVAGLSMGGTLAVFLAERHPEIAGLVLVNPLVDGSSPGIPDMIAQLEASQAELVPGIGSDIALEGSVESAYSMTPVQPMLSLLGALDGLRDDLEKIHCPVLLLTSPQDHVVHPASSDLVERAISGPVERVTLERSFHVATLDHDAALIEQRAVEFVRRVVPGGGT